MGGFFLTKIVYLPLDERPCNYSYPQMLANMTDLELIVPDKDILGDKKEPANYERVRSWLLEVTQDASELIISMDMLVYGGIVPSRLHTLTYDECQARLNVLTDIKQNNPDITIYGFNLVMRTPSKNNSDEEPAYYADYGSDIYTYGYLEDKGTHQALTGSETDQLIAIKNKIPDWVLQDYLNRRQINFDINLTTIDLVKTDVISELIIPLDDNATFGYTSQEKRQLLYRVEGYNLIDRIYIYPGADEIGCILFARVFSKLKNYRPNVYLEYSSTNGPYIIPDLEDRTLGESMKAQLMSGRARIVPEADKADIVLMIHSAGQGEKAMGRPGPYEKRHPSYFSEINYPAFIDRLQTHISDQKFVALADVAILNGSDHTLMKLLSKNKMISQLDAYGGWNTAGNTIGTVVAHSIISSYYKQEKSQADTLFFRSRIIEDWGYQTIVRHEITQNVLERYDANYFDITAAPEAITEEIHNALNRFVEYLREQDEQFEATITAVDMPWKRMFEVAIEMTT